MAATTLSTIYLQIELSETPFAILGASSLASELEVREKYLELALVVHPDKTPDDKLRELHTSLFQKVQSAYNEICKTFNRQEDHETTPRKRLPETLASLHARNVSFKEALRNEREGALDAKRISDARNAAKQATLQAKNERLTARKQNEREKMLKLQHIADAKKAPKQIALKAKVDMLAKRRQPRALPSKPFDLSLKKSPSSPEQELRSHETPMAKHSAGGDSPNRKVDSAFNWEEHEDLLGAQAQRERAAAAKAALAKPKGALRNRPTSDTAKLLWDPEIDERLVSDAKIKGSCDKSLLSGGRVGAVSLSQKKQRENSGTARIQKTNMGLCEDADNMLKPALTGNSWFCGTEEDELLYSAFVRAEHESEARTDRMLQLMDSEVKAQHLLGESDEGKLEVGLLEYIGKK